MDEAMFGSVKTAAMTEAELPTIRLKSDGVMVNTLYGYTSAIDAFSIRENLVAVEEEQTVVNPELGLGERIRAGFADSVNWMEEMLRNIIVFVVMASPVIALCAVVWLGWKIIRKLKKREG